MRRASVGALLLATGCHRAELEHGLEGARDAIEIAEPCLVETRARELGACAGDAACEAPIRARWLKIADGLDAFHAAWCIIEPKAEGCP